MRASLGGPSARAATPVRQALQRHALVGEGVPFGQHAIDRARLQQRRVERRLEVEIEDDDDVEILGAGEQPTGDLLGINQRNLSDLRGGERFHELLTVPWRDTARLFVEKDKRTGAGADGARWLRRGSLAEAVKEIPPR